MITDSHCGRIREGASSRYVHRMGGVMKRPLRCTFLGWRCSASSGGCESALHVQMLHQVHDTLHPKKDVPSVPSIREDGQLHSSVVSSSRQASAHLTAAESRNLLGPTRCLRFVGVAEWSFFVWPTPFSYLSRCSSMARSHVDMLSSVEFCRSGIIAAMALVRCSW